MTTKDWVFVCVIAVLLGPPAIAFLVWWLRTCWELICFAWRQ